MNVIENGLKKKIRPCVTWRWDHYFFDALCLLKVKNFKNEFTNQLSYTEIIILNL